MSLFKKKRPIYVQGVKLYPINIIRTELYTEEKNSYFYYKNVGLRRRPYLKSDLWGGNFPFF